MNFSRFYTKSDWNTPYDDINFESRTSEIKNPDGSQVFHMENVLVPDSWSQVATDIIAQKYFRKAGVPAALKKVKEKVVGIITHYFPKVRAAVLKAKTPLKLGDIIKIKGHSTDFTQTITSMQYNHTPITFAKKVKK